MNKVKYGLRNIHCAKRRVAADGTVTYDTPVAFPGAIKISLTKQGDSETTYADDGAYNVVVTKSGYKGSMELVRAFKKFLIDYLGQTEDQNGAVVETINDQAEEFALLFELQGDATPTRYVFYRCLADLESFEAETTAGKKTPKPDTMAIEVMPDEKNGFIKTCVEKSVNAAKYNDFFKKVYMPKFPATLKGIKLGDVEFTPEFDEKTKEYSGTTTETTTLLVAEATYDSAEIVCTLNDSVVENGEPVQWAEGANTLVIKVTVGETTETYTVTITKQ